MRSLYGRKAFPDAGELARESFELLEVESGQGCETLVTLLAELQPDDTVVVLVPRALHQTGSICSVDESDRAVVTKEEVVGHLADGRTTRVIVTAYCEHQLVLGWSQMGRKWYRDAKKTFEHPSRRAYTASDRITSLTISSCHDRMSTAAPNCFSTSAGACIPRRSEAPRSARRRNDRHGPTLRLVHVTDRRLPRRPSSVASGRRRQRAVPVTVPGCLALVAALFATFVFSSASAGSIARAGNVAARTNLILNPGAEAGAASAQGWDAVTIPAWQIEAGLPTVVRYGTKGFPPSSANHDGAQADQLFAGIGHADRVLGPRLLDQDGVPRAGEEDLPVHVPERHDGARGLWRRIAIAFTAR